jgi:large subunit ribosomal protein L10
MAITRKQKEEIVKKLTDKFDTASTVVFADYTGLTMADFSKLRRTLRQSRGTLLIAKNTLIKRALDKSKRKGLRLTQFQGPVAVAFSGDDVTAPARVLYQLALEQKRPKILKGILEDQLIEKPRVLELALLPTKQEMLGRVVSTIQAPISSFVRVLAGNLRGFIQVLTALKDAKKA